MTYYTCILDKPSLKINLCLICDFAYLQTDPQHKTDFYTNIHSELVIHVHIENV